jgi:hypothetical protein
MLRRTHVSIGYELPVVHPPQVERLFAAAELNCELVTVVFTDLERTLRALAVARGLGRALGAQVAVVAVKTPKYQPRGGGAVAAKDVELDALQSWVRAAGDVRFRVVAAPRTSDALSIALAPGSLVVVGGRRRLWPTPISRLCRLIEARGHYVLFVDEVLHAA